MRVALFLLVFLMGVEASANNTFIPNYYRGRRQFNLGPAIGWSSRKEAGGNFNFEKVKTSTGGSKYSSDDTKKFEAHMYHRTPQNASLELGMGKGKRERDYESSTTGLDYDDNSFNLHLGGGYELPTAPIAIGGYFEHEDSTYEYSQITSDYNMTSKVYNLGVGYRSPSDIYFGASYLRVEFDFGGTDSESDIYALGGGMVLGGRANPTATFESFVTYRNENHGRYYSLIALGLYNLGAFQPYAELSLSKSSGPDDDQDSDGHSLEAGVDYQFSTFYVNPQISYDATDIKDDTEEDTKETSFSLEGGYRANQMEAFLRYTDTNREDDEAGSASDDKVKTNTWVLGFNYLF